MTKERGNRILRWLDRYLGIPCVFFLGCFKRKHSFAGCDTIAILITAGIGDTVLLSAILKDLKGKKITLFTGHSNAEIARMIPDVSVVPLAIFHPLASLKKIRQQHYDLWIDANPWPRLNALFSFFSKASFKIGYFTEKQYRHYVYDKWVEHLSDRHELENLRALVSSIGIKAKESPFIPLDSSKKRSSTIALHLFSRGSRASLKEWPEEKWLHLIKSLQEKGFLIVLTGSIEDRKRLEKIVEQCSEQDSIEIVAGKLSLKETAYLLKEVDAVVSIDTGIMHLAAAIDCPLVALHGPTSPKRWGAIGKRVVSLQWNKGYQPCIQLGFESHCSSNLCMQKIEVSSVLTAIDTLLRTS